MVRDPSIVSPSLAGVFIGEGHNKHGTGSRCTLQKQGLGFVNCQIWVDAFSFLLTNKRSATVRACDLGPAGVVLHS